MNAAQDHIKEAASLIRAARYLTAFTGAGQELTAAVFYNAASSRTSTTCTT